MSKTLYEKEMIVRSLSEKHKALADSRNELKKAFEAEYDKLSAQMDVVTHQINEIWRN